MIDPFDLLHVRRELINMRTHYKGQDHITSRVQLAIGLTEELERAIIEQAGEKRVTQLRNALNRDFDALVQIDRDGGKYIDKHHSAAARARRGERL